MRTNARGLHVRYRHCFFNAAGTRVTLAALTCMICLTLCSCGPRRVRADFTGYEKSYAVTSNREVLLNLARLEQRDPTYFFKLGQISSQYRMQAALTTAGSYLPNSAATGALPGGTGGPSLNYENDPQFQFIPVDDATNARLLLSPVPSDVFYDLYDQGWRVDQLFRLMVDRIEITLPDATGGCTVHIIRNAPPPVFIGSADPIDYEHEQTAIAGYVEFLRVSAVVYALQKYGLLQLRGTDRFEPLDPNSFLSEEKNSDSDPKASSTNSEKPIITTADHTLIVTMPAPKPESGGGNSAAPTAKEFDEVAAKDEMWEFDKTKNQWRLGRKVNETTFQLTGGSIGDVENTLENLFAKDETLRELGKANGINGAPELTDILEILYNGFSIEGRSNNETQDSSFCPTDSAGWKKGAPSRLVLRSLIGLMSAAAQEQDAFDELESNTDQRYFLPLQPGSPLASLTDAVHCGLVNLANKQKGAPTGQCSSIMQGQGLPLAAPFMALVPSIERLPVLQIDWNHPSTNRPPPALTGAELKKFGLAVNYDSRDYMVADADVRDINPEECKPDSQINCFARENQFWNRDMFRLIGQLSSEVTVDISKFPLPAILQLHTD
jgi:hypothetical protein